MAEDKKFLKELERKIDVFRHQHKFPWLSIEWVEFVHTLRREIHLEIYGTKKDDRED